MSFNFKGGAASDKFAKGATSALGFFHDNIEEIWASTKKPNRRVRILPARNEELLMTDPSRATSVIPYRIPGGQEIDDHTKSEAFTGWYLIILGHRSVGRTKANYVSPLMLAGTGASAADTIDPLIDCHNWAKGNPNYAHLCDRPTTGQNGPILPNSPQSVVLFNAIYSDNPTASNSWKLGILTQSPASLNYLKEELCWPTTAGMTPVDPQWPHYLFGDITSPMGGLIGWMEKRTVGTVTPWVIRFSGMDYRMDNADYRFPVNEQILGMRYDLGSDKVLKICTPQQIVDWMISDGAFPREVILNACSHYANVPAGHQPSFAAASTGGFAPTQGFQHHQGFPQQTPQQNFGGFAPGSMSPNTVLPPTPGGFAFTGGFQQQPAAPAEDDEIDYSSPSGGGVPVPVTLASAPPVPPAPVAPATPAEPMLWAFAPGHIDAPQKMNRQQILALPGNVFEVLQVQETTRGATWVKPALLGITQATPQAAAPAPPAAPAPAAPTPPAPPAPQPAQQGAGPASMPVTAGPGLTIEEEAEYQKILAIVTGSPGSAAPDQYSRLAVLSGRRAQ